MKTSIEWCDATWNPVRGCDPVSPGCKNCYAARMAARRLPGLNSPTTGEPFAIMTPHGPRWTGKVELIESMLAWPLRRKKPLRIFVDSMSDLFHEGLTDRAINHILTVIALCQRHTFLVLTKRADRMREFFSCSDPRDAQEFFYEWGANAGDYLYRGLNDRMIHKFIDEAHSDEWAGWPLPNLHLGVSVENRAALHRIVNLRDTPAAARFLSCEPLLEDLGEFDLRGIDWVIVGGESGPGARPIRAEWVRSIQRICVATGTPFFFKQWGEWLGEGEDGGDSVLNCSDEPVRVGKKKAGHLLGGRPHRDFPEVIHG